MTFNEWVNAGSDPIHELPLTILDTSTLAEEDFAWGSGFKGTITYFNML